ncbi:oligoribonuclease [Gammaproteobacteria bacterium]|nr:oligoribonuclease [Gammaproteobacteria bacterium]
MSSEMKEKNLVWIDLEMTGLDHTKDKILEIAALVTDSNLNILKEAPTFYISQSQSIIDSMDEWNSKHHSDSGLLDLIRTKGVNEEYAESRVIEEISPYIISGVSPLCGNSIWQDRRFLERYMPELNKIFHYRNVDVSSIKELVRRWSPEIAIGIKKTGAHRALEDIKESIMELRYYRDKCFK